MTEEHTSDPEANESPGSVFGNLPGSRPGSRSPRRAGGSAAEAAERRATARARPKPKPEPRSQARPKRPATQPADRPTQSEPARDRDPAAQTEGGGGLEDIAWAGVAAAAEAATLGVRLASRAMEALRGNPERD
jgi:hypothetical protein